MLPTAPFHLTLQTEPIGVAEASALERTPLENFEQEVLRHVDAAYNLAFWLTLDESNASDLVVDACLRAFRSFDGGAEPRDRRSWLLKIVHDTCHRRRLKQDESRAAAAEFPKELSDPDTHTSNPEEEPIRDEEYR